MARAYKFKQGDLVRLNDRYRRIRLTSDPSDPVANSEGLVVQRSYFEDDYEGEEVIDLGEHGHGWLAKAFEHAGGPW